MDAQGNLYGTTWVGGAYDGGIVFELTPSGGTWTETVLWNFEGGLNDGAHSNTSLVMDAQGNLYGTTWWSGTYNSGTAFELTPSGGTWTEKVLWDFGTPTFYGENPSNLILDAKGNLYGESGGGGAYNAGKVFELTPTGNGWTETVLWNFGNGPDGQSPYGGLVFDTQGKLYGTTNAGGAYGKGTVFELTPTQSGWTEKILWSFGNGTDGFGPWDGLILDSDGNLYGTTFYGGAYSQGTVFMVTP